MAKAPASAPGGFDPDAQYEITISKAVETPGGMVLRPHFPKIVVAGSGAEAIKDVIETSQKV